MLVSVHHEGHRNLLLALALRLRMGCNRRRRTCQELVRSRLVLGHQILVQPALVRTQRCWIRSKLVSVRKSLCHKLECESQQRKRQIQKKCWMNRTHDLHHTEFWQLNSKREFCCQYSIPGYLLHHK